MSQDLRQIESKTIVQLAMSKGSLLSQESLDQAAFCALKEAIDSPFIGLCVFDIDEFNGDVFSQISTHDQGADKGNKHSIHYAKNKRPSILETLLGSFNPCSVSLESVTDLTGIDHLANQSRKVQMIPFNLDERLLGLFIHQGREALDFKRDFPALHAVMHSLLCSAYKELHANNINTVYQAVLDLMPQRVFWKNRDSTYLGCNQAFASDATLGFSKDILGKSDFDIFPDQAQLYRSDDAHTMNTRHHLINSEEPQTHQNGTTIWLRTSKRPIVNSDDQVIGMVGTYDDISELKNTQAELEHSKKNLEFRVEERTKELESAFSTLQKTQNQLIESEKMAALGNLVAGIAHEINTPIGIAVTGASSLENTVKLIQERFENNKLTKDFFTTQCLMLSEGADIILKNLRRASDLIKNFKLIAVDQTYDEIREINLPEYIKDVVWAISPKTRNHHIEVNITGDKIIEIRTYPGAIAQVITNLIENAVIHGFENQDSGCVDINLQRKGDNAIITIADSGQGMDQNVKDKIFDPFYTTKRSSGGTGLGLSIIFNLITQRLGGSIKVDSEINKGTTFTILLPEQDTQ